jgi:tyrosine-protein kinase Etk/Wzc
LINEWDGLYTELNRHGASLRRQYVEENLHQTGSELAVMEDSLRTFQEEHGISALEQQLEGTVASAVLLEQKIIDTRITIRVLEKILQSDHPELKRAKLELQEMYKQQKQFQESSNDETLLLPLGKAPEVSLAYARIFRRVQTLEAIYQILIQQFEQAKMQELKDTPAIRIVDYGKVPINKYKPKRAILVIIAFASSLFMSLIVVYFLDYLVQTRGSDESRWLEEIIQMLRNDLQKVKGHIGLGRKSK